MTLIQIFRVVEFFYKASYVCDKKLQQQQQQIWSMVLLRE